MVVVVETEHWAGFGDALFGSYAYLHLLYVLLVLHAEDETGLAALSAVDLDFLL